MELPLLSVIVVHWKTVREMAGKHLEIEKNLKEIREILRCIVGHLLLEDIWTDEWNLNV